jgi:hypothetical protein
MPKYSTSTKVIILKHTNFKFRNECGNNKQYHMDRISWMRPYIIGKDLLMQPVSITNNILSSNQPRGELYMWYRIWMTCCPNNLHTSIITVDGKHSQMVYVYSFCFHLYVATFQHAAPVYVVYISQLIRYFRACGSYQDFLDRGLLLTMKLRNQGFLLVKLKSSLRKFYVATMTWLTAMEYLCHKWPRYVPLVVNTSRSFPHSWLITWFVSRLTWLVPLVEQELLTLPEHLSSLPGFSGVRVTRSLVLYVCFIDRCLSFCTFSFGRCVVCSSSIYGFWLPLWYLQTLLTSEHSSAISYRTIITFDGHMNSRRPAWRIHLDTHRA